jgi:hypothetical protein
MREVREVEEVREVREGGEVRGEMWAVSALHRELVRPSFSYLTSVHLNWIGIVPQQKLPCRFAADSSANDRSITEMDRRSTRSACFFLDS